jgi:hypothetical protein
MVTLPQSFIMDVIFTMSYAPAHPFIITASYFVMPNSGYISL